jgi:L-lactate utilization protein LutB
MQQNHIEKYWELRLENCRKSLENNNFEAFLADNCNDAKRIVIEEILPKIEVKSVSWGDSLTLHSTKVLDVIKQNPDIDVLETFAQNVPREEIIERRRQALLVDLFFTGTNAVTETGKLVNLDMIGNRVGAITFGPKNVIIFIGRNKIVSDVETAMNRIKSYAAPVNAIRHPNLKTPCIKTSYCMDCKSPDRICNTWTITEKSFPKGRIKVVLINRNLGL